MSFIKLETLELNGNMEIRIPRPFACDCGFDSGYARHAENCKIRIGHVVVLINLSHVLYVRELWENRWDSIFQDEHERFAPPAKTEIFMSDGRRYYTDMTADELNAKINEEQQGALV